MNIACALIHLENCSTDGMIVSSLYVYTRVCTKGDVLIAGSVRQTGGRCGPHNTSTQLLLARTWTEEQWTLDKQREDLYLDVTYSCLPYGQAIFCTPRSEGKRDCFLYSCIAKTVPSGDCGGIAERNFEPELRACRVSFDT